MESDEAQNSEDPGSALAVVDQARHRLSAGLRLPKGVYPVLAAAVAVQVGTAAYGIANHAASGLAVALGGVTVSVGTAAVILWRFRHINGVRVDALTSQVVLGEGPTSTTAYVASFGLALWAANESRWWLVALAAVAGGVGYAFGMARWWRAYLHDPAAHARGMSPRALAGLAALAGLGLVALVLAS